MTVEASAAGIQGILDADPDLKGLWSYAPQVTCAPMNDHRSHSMVVDLYLPREKVTLDNLHMIATHFMQHVHPDDIPDEVDTVEILPCAFEGRADPAPILRMRVPVDDMDHVSLGSPQDLVRHRRGNPMQCYWYWNPNTVPAH